MGQAARRGVWFAFTISCAAALTACGESDRDLGPSTQAGAGGTSGGEAHSGASGQGHAGSAGRTSGSTGGVSGQGSLAGSSGSDSPGGAGSAGQGSAGAPGGTGGGGSGAGGAHTAGAGGAVPIAGAASGGGGAGGASGAPAGGTSGTGGALGFALTVTATGPAGSVTSLPAGQVACNAPNSAGDCSQAYSPGTLITLTATAANGVRARFSGWSGACSGIAQTCTVTMDAAKTVGATFVAYTNNLVFVSSATYQPNLQSATAYDPLCNQLATAAGVNNAAGTGFIAWTSDSHSDAVTRLGSARGFIAMDGAPFADSQTAFLTGNAILNPIRVTEKGAVLALTDVMTATNSLGKNGSDAFNRNCNDWTGSTTTSDQVLSGSTLGGPVSWDGITAISCTMARRIYCFGKTETAALVFTPATGKRIWLSTPYSPSPDKTPDAHCALSKPTGVSAARALVAYSSAPASDVLTPTATYVRPDGVVVGTGAEIAANTLRSGVWQYGDGSYVSTLDNGSLTFTGAASLTVNGTATCGNWQDSTAMVVTGDFHTAGAKFWNYVSVSCNVSAKLYCVEP